MLHRLKASRMTRSHHSQGQGLVEFALVLPVLLLLLVAAVDFGRVYLGWINLNQMARIAANYAAINPDADFASASGTYQTLVLQDARANNCDLVAPGTAPAPTFPSGTDLGDPATVRLTCEFTVLTPILSNILGGTVPVSASSTFPVRSGAVSGIPVGGGTSNVPIAEFSGSPTSGLEGMVVQFQDESQNAPLLWDWDFGDGGFSFAQNPSHTYTAPGTYTVTLTASNPAGGDTETKVGYIVVSPLPTGLTADFSGTPTSGVRPLNVAFTDLSTGNPTSWSWTFGDGGTSTAQDPSHNYTAAGVYDVTLTVSDGTTSNSQTKTAYITVDEATCIVPNVSDGFVRKVAARQTLEGLGFVVVTVGDNTNWRVSVQIPQGGLEVPCGSTVTIYQ